MGDKQDIRDQLNDELEWQFVLDYSAFGMRINFEAITVLYENALSEENSIRKKSLCLSGMQLMFSSWEDFALLLQAFRKKNEGLHIHRFLGRDEQKQGSSDVPGIFKHYTTARKMLDELGFTAINIRLLNRHYMNLSKKQFETNYSELANTVKVVGKEQQENNELKNRLKHGKGVFEGKGLLEGVTKEKRPDRVAYLKWVQEKKGLMAHLHWYDASLEHFETAVIHVAKLYRRSLELLWFFMIQHHPVHAQDCQTICLELAESCRQRVTSLGIKSKGLNV